MRSGKKREGTNTVTKKVIWYGRDLNRGTLNELDASTLKNLDDIGNFLQVTSQATSVIKIDLKIIENFNKPIDLKMI